MSRTRAARMFRFDVRLPWGIRRRSRPNCTRKVRPIELPGPSIDTQPLPSSDVTIVTPAVYFHDLDQ
jgi:hypothetical protein